ncbi:hypothetical protein ABRY23_07575 [Melioribacteraceae bacterium 4301-Me]|uniref:hypothetical protein n=1 Tax=Pyranulibacter aquaticus TaxID=3163344 RepID=UPI00359775ED
MRRIFLFVSITFSTLLFAQKNQKFPLTGVLNFDSYSAYLNSEKINELNDSGIKNTKSPFLAGLLSLIVPGTGEFYSKSYIKAGIFFVAEVTAVTVGLIYNKKGDDQTNFFQNFADEHWSVVRYAQYALEHLAPKDPPGGPYQLFYPDKQNLPPWEQVNWSELNRMERDIGGYYSHTLPRHGDQQYYEEIGKYPQFNQGWDDAPPQFNYGDPVTPNFHYYSGLRGKANDYYDIASKAVIVVFLNHLISAIDAVWTAHSYNKHISISAELTKTTYGIRTDYYPKLNLRYNF